MPEISPYQQFAVNMLHNDSVYIPKILESMISEEQARLLITLPATAEEATERLQRPLEAVTKDLNDLFRKGLAFKKLKKGHLNWRPPAHIAQFHDATIVWPEAPESFYLLWRRYMEEEWPQLAPTLATFLPRPFTRVIPVNKSIETGQVQVLAPENVRQIIQQAEKIAVTKCTCRLSMGKCDAPIEVCLQINRGAEYTIERGTGKELDVQQALDILTQSEAAGLVHVTMNKADLGHFICNCCGCCCQSFSLLIADGVPLCDPSRFAPHIDREACTACGTCQERCWFGAIEIGAEDCAVVNEAKCLGCGQCAVGCPQQAIDMREVRQETFIPQ